MSIIVLGTKTTCLRLLARLGDRVSTAITLDDSSDTRSRLGDIVAHGENLRIPVIVSPSPKDAYARIVALAPKVVLVAGWYRIIPDDVLEASEHGFVGAHYSALPQYRGSAPVVWAMINGEEAVGFSLFQLTAGMDEGPVAAQGLVPIDRDDTIATVLDKLDDAALDAFDSVADAIVRDEQKFVAQSTIGVSYAGTRLPEDGDIDWTAPAEIIERFVRAQTRPYPGAFSNLGGSKVNIWAATASSLPHFGAPGQVVRMEGARPVVACGGGTGLILDEIEAENRPKFSLLSSRFGPRR